MVKSPLAPAVIERSSANLAECGFKTETVIQPDGTELTVQIPLTEAEFLHPKEGYHLPNSTFHDRIAGDVRDMLTRRYESDPEVCVYRDLLILWDNADLGDSCPDTFVVFGIKNKEQDRSTFVVANEQVRPALVVEVVSPRYRKADREAKVVLYAQAKVQEYVILDRRKYRGQVRDEVLGYRLVSDRYQPITPDDDGRIFCDTVGLWISLQDGCLVMEDAISGDRLPTSLELQAERDLAQQQAAEAQQQAAEAQQQAAEAQQQAADLAALLARYQERFGELPDSNVD